MSRGFTTPCSEAPSRRRKHSRSGFSRRFCRPSASMEPTSRTTSWRSGSLTRPTRCIKKSQHIVKVCHGVLSCLSCLVIFLSCLYLCLIGLSFFYIPSVFICYVLSVMSYCHVLSVLSCFGVPLSNRSADFGVVVFFSFPED